MLGSLELLPRPAEAQPSYQGKPLAVWLSDLDFSHSARDLQASNAVHSMGTNVLPYLAPMFGARDSEFSQALRRLLSRQRFIPIQFVPADLQQQRAARACRVLGPAAQGYLPHLRVMLGSTNHATAWCAYTAITALKFGTNAVREYVIALTNNFAQLRQVAADRLGAFGEAAAPAIPVLVLLTADRDDGVRRSSLRALARLQVDAETFLPILLARIEDPSPAVRKAAVETLVRYGRNSEAARAKLQACQMDSDPQVRGAAGFALQELRKPEP